MNFIAPLLLVGLMGTAFSSPAPCNAPCALTIDYHQPDFKHVSELGQSSVAPWNMNYDIKAEREPQVIEYADCKNCTEEHMIAKPIILQVMVYERMHSGSGSAWCKCPFRLAVGCTCVKKQ